MTPATHPARLRLLNLAASLAVVALACTLHRYAPYSAAQFAPLYQLGIVTYTGGQYLLAAAAAYGLALAAFFLADTAPAPSKSLRFFQVLRRLARAPRQFSTKTLSAEDRVAVLATLLKAFFGPLMLMSLMIFCESAVNNGLAIFHGQVLQDGLRATFDRHGFWFLMQVILFVDVLIFTGGYLIESPRLGNTIRSVDPTWLGWAAAMICYPPFNHVTGMLLGSQVSDFPQFDDPMAHFVLNVLLLILMAIYSWASVALGFKASNLTHRGIIARGPYAVIRHPAYVCKNLAWWIGATPAVSAAFQVSLWSGLTAVGSVLGWSMIYVLRALTEEDHLRRVDTEYAAYATRVRHRFIPGVY